MSIRRRLLLIVLLAMLPPTLLVMARFAQDYNEQIGRAMSRLKLGANDLAANLDEKIQGTTQMLYGLARATDLGSRDREACSTFLSDVREEYPLYTGILTIQPDGRLFCDSLKTGRELDLHDQHYFRETAEGADDLTLEPGFGRLSGLAVLEIGFPVRGPDGALERVILASINLAGFLANEIERSDATAIVIDRRGTFLAAVPGTPALKALVNTDISASEIFHFAEAHPEGGVAELAGFDGQRQVWAVAPQPQPNSRDPGLFILIGRSKAELVAPANERLYEDAFILLLLSLALVGGAWLVAEHAIRRPVKRIAAAVRRLGRGDLATRLDGPIPRGELGELMDAVNVAACSLQNQRTDIETLHAHLRQAQKMEAIGQLTGGIAHDFNNLMTVILGNAEMLSEELEDRPDLKPLTDTSLAAAERAADLTRSLLAFARKQPLRPRSTDINDLLSRMRPIIDRSIGQQIVCSFVLAPDAWPALVDATQLESAVLNLAINARDAMENGGHLVIESANLTLDAAKAAMLKGSVPGDYATINVRDTGTGMTDEVKHKAFEPFFTTKEVGKGSGLGLSMVYGFVKQSNGYVELVSIPDRGTSVTLYLPRAKD